MHRSRLNPNLQLDTMALYKEQRTATSEGYSLDHIAQPVSQGKTLLPQESKPFLIEDRLEVQDLLPEPMGGHRANLITYGIRGHLHGIDTDTAWAENFKREQHYHNMRELMRATTQQTGNTASLHAWLDYIHQMTGGPSDGHRLDRVT